MQKYEERTRQPNYFFTILLEQKKDALFLVRSNYFS